MYILCCVYRYVLYVVCIGMYYVVVDGKEGWIPSDILKMTSESGMWSMSSSVSSLASRGRSHSRSVSPSPMASRSPSPMDLSEFDPCMYIYNGSPLL